MRLLMSGTRAPTTLPSEYAAGLEELGCTLAKHYGTDDRPTHLPSIVRKAARRVMPRALFQPSNRDLLALAEFFAPQVVWLFKGIDIFPGTVRELRRRGFHPVAYNADHPFEFFSRGSGNEFVARAVPEYELFMTFSRHIARQLADRHPRLLTCVIPFGHSVDESTFESIASSNKEVGRVCFLGNADDNRAARISVLLSAGIEVDIYGHFWNKFRPRVADARLFAPVYGLDMYRTLRRYRVQLNFLRPHNVNSHNMRSFEAPACGAIMLAEDTVEHREFFRPDVEAFYFTSDEELIGQARRLLALSADEAGMIRARARARSVEQPFTYSDRAAQALTHLKRFAR